MSVIFFSAEELGEVVAALPGSYDKRRAYDVLAAYSIANARAYARSYPREPTPTPCTADEIAAASQVMVDEPLERWGSRRDRAENTAALLVYNSISNSGECFLADVDRADVVELEIMLSRAETYGPSGT